MKAWTKGRLTACLLADLEHLGFRPFTSEAIRFENEDIHCDISVDLAASREIGANEKLAYITFSADFKKAPAGDDPRRIRGLWSFTFDEYHFLGESGSYQPYTLSSADSYESTNIHRDVTQYLIPFLSRVLSQNSLLSFLKGETFTISGQSIVPFANEERNKSALCLYVANKLGNVSVAQIAAANLRNFALGSEENSRSVKALLARKSDVREALKAVDEESLRIIEDI